MSTTNTELREAIKKAIDWHGPQAGVVVMRITLEELTIAGFDPGTILAGSLEHGAERIGPIVLRHIANAIRGKSTRR